MTDVDARCYSGAEEYREDCPEIAEGAGEFPRVKADAPLEGFFFAA